MIFLLALLLIALVMVLVTALVEAWARHAHWPGYDDRPLRDEPRRPWGKG